MKDNIKKTVCAWLGHTDITNTFFGYHSCARCGAHLGDSLGGYYQNSREVIVGHNCKTCRANYKKLGWKDKLLTPDPFTKEK